MYELGLAQYIILYCTICLCISVRLCECVNQSLIYPLLSYIEPAKPSELQIPVNCPVSGIVKPRKIQGKECFEVLWEGLQGLKTSIVPADLVQR